MSTFANGTSVPAARSRAEIEETLRRYGADSFGYMTDKEKATIGFQTKGRCIKLTVALPTTANLPKREGPLRHKPYTDTQVQAWLEMEYRRRWRCMLLVIKAKLEAVESGIAIFEDEFLPYIVTASGQTVAEVLRPQLQDISDGRTMPMLLAEGGAK